MEKYVQSHSAPPPTEKLIAYYVNRLVLFLSIVLFASARRGGERLSLFLRIFFPPGQPNKKLAASR